MKTNCSTTVGPNGSPSPRPFPLVTRHPSPVTLYAFTLLELLTVIAIIGIVAALSVPVIRNLRPSAQAAATRQLLDDVHRARQLAISQRTTVYMVFLPTNFWYVNNKLSGTAYGGNTLPTLYTNLYDKQQIAYTFVALHSLGDQPGRPTAHYLAPWRTLPEGTFFPFQKFAPRSSATPNLTISNQLTLNPPSFLTYSVYPFRWTNNIPFPSEEAQAAYPPTLPPNPYPWLPYIAFNYLGQLVDPANPNIPLTTDEYIPLAQGGAFFQRDQHTGKGARALPSFAENPAGNVSNAFTLVKIQGLTGRARIEKQQVLQ